MCGGTDADGCTVGTMESEHSLSVRSTLRSLWP
jgi:hypothetical protein